MEGNLRHIKPLANITGGMLGGNWLYEMEFKEY